MRLINFELAVAFHEISCGMWDCFYKEKKIKKLIIYILKSFPKASLRKLCIENILLLIAAC